MKTIIVYGSTTGATEDVATQIHGKFESADLVNVRDLDFRTLAKYDLIILGTSTWGIGDLQDEWEDAIGRFTDIDLSGKYVALFGLGDQEGYPDSYIDGVNTIYQEAIKLNPTVIGFTSTDGYSCDASTAIHNDKFIGLALDEDNQSNMTEKRVNDWVEQIKSEVK